MTLPRAYREVWETPRPFPYRTLAMIICILGGACLGVFTTAGYLHTVRRNMTRPCYIEGDRIVWRGTMTVPARLTRDMAMNLRNLFATDPSEHAQRYTQALGETIAEFDRTNADA